MGGFRLIGLTVALGMLAGAWPAGALGIGDPMPALSFTDVEGAEATSARYAGWVQVVTVADRESSEQMTAWMNQVGIEIVRKYPTLRVAYLGIADMQIVPRMMRSVATPILRRINRRSQTQQDELYAKAGVRLDRTQGAFHLIPDWDGAFLEALGVEDTSVWRCWVVVGGTVVEAIDGTTPDGQARYLAAFARAGVSPSGGQQADDVPARGR